MSRPSLALLFCIASVSASAVADDSPRTDAVPPSDAAGRRCFVVEIAELTLRVVDDSTAKAFAEASDLRGLVERVAASELARGLETISLQVTDSGQPARAQVGQTVAVLRSVATGGNRPMAPVASFQERQVGTMVNVSMQSLERGGNDMVVDLQYEASRVVPTASHDVPATTTTRTVATTLRLQVGESVIAHTFSGDDVTLLCVTLSERHVVRPHAERLSQPIAIAISPAIGIKENAPDGTVVGTAGADGGPATTGTVVPRENVQQPEVTRFRKLNLPTATDQADSRERFAKMIFERADANQDNAISFNEAQEISVLFRRFHEMDQNGDEVLSSGEIVDGLLGGNSARPATSNPGTSAADRGESESQKP